MGEPAAQHSQQQDDGVTVMVTRTPRPGQEAAYEQWLHGVSAVAHAFPGHQGVTVIKPVGSREYHLVFRFDTQAHLAAWEASQERREWVERADALCERPAEVVRLTGLEGWFVLPNRAVKPPPRWKMALVTWGVAFTLIQLLQAALLPWLGSLPLLARGVVLSGCMVVLMTYFVMPRVTRLLARWLYPH